MLYFTADTHFNHANIIKNNKRPFSNVEQMNNILIQNWNSCVSEDDEIYILGDFMLNNGTGKDANNILRRLNGKKYLIKGNHDENYLKDEDFDEGNFLWIDNYHAFFHNKIKIILFHYPILEWDKYSSDAVHLFGHVHNYSKYPEQQKRVNIVGKRAINVGVDVNNFRPISIEKILKMVG
jgi:calcineurin-like phosphoesterase family protein